MTVAFLTARVKSPDEDEWGTLKRVLKYLNGTKFLKLRLTKYSLGVLKWYVDGSHNAHWDCRGHGGAVFTLGRGATMSYSRKLKLNTRSSTETELVRADIFMPEMLCLCTSYKHKDRRWNASGYIKITPARSTQLH